MKLISCEGCGAVLDADRLKFPQDIYTESEEINQDLATWSGRAWVPFCHCPVCRAKILKE